MPKRATTQRHVSSRANEYLAIEHGGGDFVKKLVSDNEEGSGEEKRDSGISAVSQSGAKGKGPLGDTPSRTLEKDCQQIECHESYAKDCICCQRE